MHSISDTGINLIKQFETLKLKAYKAVKTEKYYTIGYGHYGADVEPNMTITEAEALELFKKDLQRFERAVNRLVKVDITQNQYDALVSFSFNVGIKAFAGSTMLKFINVSHFPLAAGQFDLWVKSGGVVLNGLVKRRKIEKELFLKQ